MSTALQVALFLASIAFILLVLILIPLAFQARERLARLALAAEHLKASLDLLVFDSRSLIRHADELAARANRQMDDVSQGVRTVRRWTERADRMVDEVGSVIEPPVYALVRNMNLLRVVTTAFVQAFLKAKRNKTGE